MLSSSMGLLFFFSFCMCGLLRKWKDSVQTVKKCWAHTDAVPLYETQICLGWQCEEQKITLKLNSIRIWAIYLEINTIHPVILYISSNKYILGDHRRQKKKKTDRPENVWRVVYTSIQYTVLYVYRPSFPRPCIPYTFLYFSLSI